MLSQFPTIAAPSNHVLALDLHNSADTFHTAHEIIGSIEAFITAHYATARSVAFFTAEEIIPVSIVQNNSDERNRIYDPSATSPHHGKNPGETRETVRDVVAEQTSKKTNQLAFTNYSRIELGRKGRGKHKRYVFSYWGRTYYRTGSAQSLRRPDPCRIVTATRSISFAMAMASTDWVPAWELHFANPKLESSQQSLYESGVLVATGVVALVDNAIRSYLAVLDAGGAGLIDLVVRDRRMAV
ncbi:hypothetical protein PMIN04_003343 [Paraphaeosphaeria minitans]